LLAYPFSLAAQIKQLPDLGYIQFWQKGIIFNGTLPQPLLTANPLQKRIFVSTFKINQSLQALIDFARLPSTSFHVSNWSVSWFGLAVIGADCFL